MLGDDLFGSSETTALAKSTKTSSDTTKASQTPNSTPSPSFVSPSSRFLSDASHRLRFNEARASLSKFCGNRPATRYLPRQSALLRLAALAQDSEDLEALIVTIVAWRQAKRQVNSQTSHEIISRCVKLGRPDLALRLLIDRPKYGVDLVSISVARALLHELIEVARRPTKSSKCTPVSSFQDDPFLLASLYPKFRLRSGITEGDGESYAGRHKSRSFDNMEGRTLGEHWVDGAEATTRTLNA